MAWLFGQGARRSWRSQKKLTLLPFIPSPSFRHYGVGCAERGLGHASMTKEVLGFVSLLVICVPWAFYETWKVESGGWFIPTVVLSIALHGVFGVLWQVGTATVSDDRREQLATSARTHVRWLLVTLSAAVCVVAVGITRDDHVSRWVVWATVWQSLVVLSLWLVWIDVRRAANEWKLLSLEGMIDQLLLAVLEYGFISLVLALGLGSLALFEPATTKSGGFARLCLILVPFILGTAGGLFFYLLACCRTIPAVYHAGAGHTCDWRKRPTKAVLQATAQAGHATG